MPFAGELSALATAIFWSGTAIFFAAASKRVGSMRVNIARLALAFVLLTATIALTGLPVTLSFRQVLLLAVSGAIGLVFGDGFLFRAFKDIGPRISMLVMSLAPALAALLAYIFLDESIALLGLLGMAITISGIVLVVSERRATESLPDGVHWFGVLFAFFGAIGQAGGLILAKLAFNEAPVHGMVATTVRVAAALVVFLPLLPFLSSFRNPIETFRKDMRAFGLTFLGALFGPYFGITFSLIAIMYAKVGIAATIMALPPIIMLPILRYGFKEKLTARAVIGACIAVAGVALLFLR